MYFKLFIIINSLCSLLPIYSNILPSKCGLTPFYSNKLPDTRIKGGRKAKIGSWPWAVSIAVYGKPRCGGTIIHERFVLTAAHCVFQYGEIPYVFPINAFTIIVGSIDRFKEGNRKIPVVGVYPHEEYRHKRPTNDIALIKLACSVPLENKTTKIEGKIVPICLPPIYQKYNKNTVCFAIGWGFLDTTQRPAILREKKINTHYAASVTLRRHQELREIQVVQWYAVLIEINGLLLAYV
ncbi:hypothetical protein SNEBB_002314 [Seison nebaliae]|nr:hypothetical protein SNEBB_002314 [Seison nebaliae]